MMAMTTRSSISVNARENMFFRALDLGNFSLIILDFVMAFCCGFPNWPEG